MKKYFSFLLALVLAGGFLRAQKLPELPFVDDLRDPAFFTASARALFLDDELRDSASFMAGSRMIQSFREQNGAFSMERFAKGFRDFQQVDLRTFTREVTYGFGLNTGIEEAFEVPPSRLDGLTEVSPRTAAQQDSLGYLLGVALAYACGSSYLDLDRVLYGAEHPSPRDVDAFDDVIRRYEAMRNEAYEANVQDQGERFYNAAAMLGFQRIPVKYLRTKGSTNRVPLYRYVRQTQPDGYQIQLGDGFLYHCHIQHVDGTDVQDDLLSIDSLDSKDLIKGLTAALLMLHFGDVLEVVIPPDYAYHQWGLPCEWDPSRTIAPNETLFCTLYLVEDDGSY